MCRLDENHQVGINGLGGLFTLFDSPFIFQQDLGRKIITNFRHEINSAFVFFCRIETILEHPV